MKVRHDEKVDATRVTMEGATGCTMRALIGQSDGAPNFAMRQFIVAPGGHTPRHQHPYEHEVFVLEGTGVVIEGDKSHALRPGAVVFVAPDEVHQFQNTGATALKFLCLVPLAGSVPAPTVPPAGGE